MTSNSLSVLTQENTTKIKKSTSSSSDDSYSMPLVRDCTKRKFDDLDSIEDSSNKTDGNLALSEKQSTANSIKSSQHKAQLHADSEVKPTAPLSTKVLQSQVISSSADERSNSAVGPFSATPITSSHSEAVSASLSTSTVTSPSSASCYLEMTPTVSSSATASGLSATMASAGSDTQSAVLKSSASFVSAVSSTSSITTLTVSTVLSMPTITTVVQSQATSSHSTVSTPQTTPPPLPIPSAVQNISGVPLLTAPVKTSIQIPQPSSVQQPQGITVSGQLSEPSWFSKPLGLSGLPASATSQQLLQPPSTQSTHQTSLKQQHPVTMPALTGNFMGVLPPPQPGVFLPSGKPIATKQFTSIGSVSQQTPVPLAGRPLYMTNTGTIGPQMNMPPSMYPAMVPNMFQMPQLRQSSTPNNLMQSSHLMNPQNVMMGGNPLQYQPRAPMFTPNSIPSSMHQPHAQFNTTNTMLGQGLKPAGASQPCSASSLLGQGQSAQIQSSSSQSLPNTTSENSSKDVNNMVDPVLFEQVKAQLKQAYPDMARDPILLEKTANQQTLVLQKIVNASKTKEPTTITHKSTTITTISKESTTNKEKPVAKPVTLDTLKAAKSSPMKNPPGFSKMDERPGTQLNKPIASQTPNSPVQSPKETIQLKEYKTNITPVENAWSKQPKSDNNVQSYSGATTYLPNLPPRLQKLGDIKKTQRATQQLYVPPAPPRPRSGESWDNDTEPYPDQYKARNAHKLDPVETRKSRVGVGQSDDQKNFKKTETGNVNWWDCDFSTPCATDEQEPPPIRRPMVHTMSFADKIKGWLGDNDTNPTKSPSDVDSQQNYRGSRSTPSECDESWDLDDLDDNLHCSIGKYFTIYSASLLCINMHTI